MPDLFTAIGVPSEEGVVLADSIYSELVTICSVTIVPFRMASSRVRPVLRPYSSNATQPRRAVTINTTQPRKAVAINTKQGHLIAIGE